MSGQAFEFTPAGVQPLNAPVASFAEVIPAGQAIATLKRRVEEQEAARVATAPAPVSPTRPNATPPALTGRSLTKQIRARLKTVRLELKALQALEREEAELKRLLAAAKQPPAAVTHITSARKSG